MLRILHFSDFHLNKKNLDDWNYFIKKALLDELKKTHEQEPIDLIFLTGDLIDKGGIAFGSIEKAFEEFRGSIIEPIIQTLGLSIEHFLIIPGNHDLDQNADKEFTDIGLRSYFKSPEIIQEFIKNGKKGDLSGFERIKEFKEFEKRLYKGVSNCSLSPFDSNFILNIKGTKIGVSCLNSSWRCYDSKNDKGRILIGDTQLASSYNFISECDVKIALVHHPYDWVNEVEKRVIHNHLHNNYNLMFIGHVHEGETSVETNYAGSLFVNVAPGALTDIRSDSRRYSTGYTIIDFQDENKVIKCYFKRYNHTSKTFVDNTDLGENGKLTFDTPQQGRLKEIKSAQDHLKTIVDVRFDEMNEHLISSVSELGPKTIKECFILPSISDSFYEENDEGVLEEAHLSLQEILSAENDLLLFGGKEAGKTTLLFRLVHEYVERFEFKKVVPVYIDFLEIGNREIENCIKGYLSCNNDELKSLLDNRDLVLLIDNLQWDEEHSFQVKKLSKFKSKYKPNSKNKQIKIIATGYSEISGVIPSDFELTDLNFQTYFIESLHTNQIKSLIEKWVDVKDSNDLDKKLEKIVDNFKSFALPRTAMSVSLFLWTMENKDRKPINNATMLDIYLDIVLQKLQGDEIYREKFDVENKMMLLSHIASKMLERKLPNYSIEYAELVKIVDDYLNKDVGFPFDAQRLVDYFLNRKIFVKFQLNKVKFRYDCFFKFFLAKRMAYNSEFKDYVLDESRYHHFVSEIDYYTGLVRSDKALVNLIHQRFIEEFKPYESVLENINIDTHFNTEKPFVRDLSINKIKGNRPTNKQLERQTDAFLESLPNPEIIPTKEERKTLEVMLVIMANILRNSEGVEDLALKKQIYSDILQNTMTFILLYQFVMVEYYSHYESLPPNIPKDYNLKAFLRNIPFHVQMGMSEHLASLKLSNVVLAKINSDNLGKSLTGSEIERFLSVFLYADFQGDDYPKHLRKFVKSVKNNAVMDYSLFKLWNYTYTRGKSGSSNEEIFLDIISLLKIKTESLPKRMRDSVIRALRDQSKGKKLTD
jgi:predicted phosphodiesterase/GTPase SAR1 family protein